MSLRVNLFQVGKMGGKLKKLIFIMALPLMAGCSHEASKTAQNLDYSLNTASGNSVEISSPAAIIANPEGTKVALQCQDKANSVKQSGETDAASQDVYYSCLQTAFNLQ